MNALVIVDPQNDFINGSLAVPGAEKAINNTIEFIKEHKEDLAYIGNNKGHMNGWTKNVYGLAHKLKK